MRKKTNKVTAAQAILFDLDGTLLDTAPDLAFALNKLRQQRNLPDLSLNVIRPAANLGSKAMLKLAFDIDEQHNEFSSLREEFLGLYEKHLADSTTFFPHIEKVLLYIEECGVPWGIVTNKLARHTLPLLKALSMEHRPECVICGDSLPFYKPRPEPIIHACELMNRTPQDCVYIGDSATDVVASKAAGTKSLVALYGYNGNENPRNWQADGYVKEPLDIISWLEGKCS